MESRVLVVDDEQIITLHLEDLLTSMGYSVVGTASSGQGGIDRAKELMPDIVFMDIVMPGKKDGITAAKEIIEDLDIPVIFLTAYGEGSIIEKAKTAKPYAFLHKPFQTHDLRSAIEISLTRKKLENQLAESEKRYRSLVEETRDGVAIIQNGVLSFTNAAMKDMLGNPKGLDVLPLKNFFDEPSVEKISLLCNNGSCVSSLDDFVLKRKDGVAVPVEANSTSIEYNGKPAILAFFRNTEERKKGEALLEYMVRELNEKNQYLISSTEKVISAVDGPVVDDLGSVQDMLFQSSETLGKAYRLLQALQSRAVPVDMDMDKTINSALDMARGKFPEKHLVCRIDPVSLPFVVADEAVTDCLEFIFERIAGSGGDNIQIDVFGSINEEDENTFLELQIKDDTLPVDISVPSSDIYVVMDEDSLIVSILGYVMGRSQGNFCIGKWKEAKDGPMAYVLTLPLSMDKNN